MLTVNIICIGKIKEKFFTDAINEYSKRLSAFCKFNITELDEEKLPQNPSDSQIEKTINAEGERCFTVQSEEEAKKRLDDWYIDYIYVG